MTKAADCKGHQPQKPPPKKKKTKRTGPGRRNNRKYENVGCWPKISALLTRVLFMSHTGFALWRVSQVYGDSVLYYLIVGVGCLILETSFTMAVRQGKEYKWYCPSVFFYLLSVVPCIWLLELDNLNGICVAQNKTPPGILTVFSSSLPSSQSYYSSSSNEATLNRTKHRRSLPPDPTIIQDLPFISSINYILPNNNKNTVDNNDKESIPQQQHYISNRKYLYEELKAAEEPTFSGDGGSIATKPKGESIEGMTTRPNQFSAATTQPTPPISKSTASPKTTIRQSKAYTTASYQTATSRTGGPRQFLKGAAEAFQLISNESKIIGKGINDFVQIMDRITENAWILGLHQTLLFVLVIGRWLLPKGDITRNQLSQLLLVFIGVGADILEFATETLDDDDKACEMATLHILIYVVWTWSLIQFTLVLTASKSRRTRVCYSDAGEDQVIVGNDGCCTRTIFGNAEVWGILATLICQDVPFLTFRLYTIIQYRLDNQMMIFFTGKNILVVFLQMYRLCILQMEKNKQPDPTIPSEELIPLRGTLLRLAESSKGGQQVADMHVQNVYFTQKPTGETIVKLHLEKEGGQKKHQNGDLTRNRAQTT